MRLLTAANADIIPARSITEDVSLDSDVGSRGSEKCGGSSSSSNSSSSSCNNSNGNSNGCNSGIRDGVGYASGHDRGQWYNDSDSSDNGYAFWECTSSIQRTSSCVSMKIRFGSPCH
ncbi:PREDICTED: uncharacterized protein LOC108766464 [Trachymyrmex cornetzi]|uniref:uncharacterized protein LOC108766464 n=1 Tax=Trachymyrmex cornetzi TaxID=471704 RepID=UPI00084F2CCE|nr:PREDICTED: uncharacterized protein LOC108766464 [Trachymyrmex cornetzi]